MRVERDALETMRVAKTSGSSAAGVPGRAAPKSGRPRLPTDGPGSRRPQTTQEFFRRYQLSAIRLFEPAVDRGQELSPLFGRHLVVVSEDRHLDLRRFGQLALFVDDDPTAFDVPPQDRHFDEQYGATRLARNLTISLGSN